MALAVYLGTCLEGFASGMTAYCACFVDFVTVVTFQIGSPTLGEAPPAGYSIRITGLEWGEKCPDQV